MNNTYYNNDLITEPENIDYFKSKIIIKYLEIKN